MTYRLAKKRTLQKAGFVHVAGWVQEKDALKVQKLIEKVRAEVAAKLEETT